MRVRLLLRVFGCAMGILISLGIILVPISSKAQHRSFVFDIRSAGYKGLQYYYEQNYSAAIPLLEQAIKQPKNRYNQSLLLGLAHSYAIVGSSTAAALWYTVLKESGHIFDHQHQLLYANALMGSGKWEEGRQLLKNYFLETGEEYRVKALDEQAVSELFRDSVRYSVSPVSINSSASEFSPLVVPYGILFVAERPRAGLVQNRFSADESSGLDIFYGRITDGGDINKIVRLNDVVNSQLPEGPVAITTKGKKIFFTRSGKKGEMQIFQARSIFNFTTWFDEEEVTLPVKGSVGHPAVSENGQVLYFISDMPGGFGGTDIYKVERTKNGWSEPLNLGPRINTAGNELFPSLHGNDKLYFSSNGHFGLGGLDIYEALFKGDTLYNLRNMGTPVNSPGDDFSLSMNANGTWGYFSSNRDGGAGKDDIYRLNVHIISLAGRVFDKTNGKSVGGTTVQLYQNGLLLQESVTDKNGSYAFQLYPGEEYELRYESEEYRELSEKFSTRQGPSFGTRKWETGIDRKVKMFVLGTIKKSNNDRAGGASLLAIEEVTGRREVVEADNRGNYELELDAFNKYKFWTICDGEAAVAEFSTPEKGKASLSYYVDLDLIPSLSYQVHGTINAVGGKKGPFVINRLNKLTLEQDFILTDERGKFSFEAQSVADYELCPLHTNEASPVQLSSGWTQNERTVLIEL